MELYSDSEYSTVSSGSDYVTSDGEREVVGNGSNQDDFLAAVRRHMDPLLWCRNPLDSEGVSDKELLAQTASSWKLAENENVAAHNEEPPPLCPLCAPEHLSYSRRPSPHMTPHCPNLEAVPVFHPPTDPYRDPRWAGIFAYCGSPTFDQFLNQDLYVSRINFFMTSGDWLGVIDFIDLEYYPFGLVPKKPKIIKRFAKLFGSFMSLLRRIRQKERKQFAKELLAYGTRALHIELCAQHRFPEHCPPPGTGGNGLDNAGSNAIITKIEKVENEDNLEKDKAVKDDAPTAQHVEAEETGGISFERIYAKIQHLGLCNRKDPGRRIRSLLATRKSSPENPVIIYNWRHSGERVHLGSWLKSLTRPIRTRKWYPIEPIRIWDPGGSILSIPFKRRSELSRDTVKSNHSNTSPSMDTTLNQNPSMDTIRTLHPLMDRAELGKQRTNHWRPTPKIKTV